MKRSTFVKTEIAYELQREQEIKCNLLLSVARIYSHLYQMLLLTSNKVFWLRNFP